MDLAPGTENARRASVRRRMSLQPRYPIYIPSKVRWVSRLRLTSRYLERMGVDYRIIVEESEAASYSNEIDRRHILILDATYQRSYDACMVLAPGQSTGSGPARNFAWDHAQSVGAPRHWVIDDNIAGFYRFHENRKTLMLGTTVFRVMEDFVDRYSNVAMAGPHYEHFVLRHAKHAPFKLNTRIYSCNLIQTNAPFRWRGRYNEDTILSLDMLKAGWCTILFIALLQNKVATQRLEGGNTDELYKGGTLEKSRMLIREHPDVARLTRKWNRWHHYVDYRPFKGNKLIRKPGVMIPQGVNNYGMVLWSRES
jgi:hypothetical protein